MTSTQAVISSASPARTPANELLPVQQQQRQTDTKELLYQLPIQRKLSVGAADDPLEKEADDMADKVMRMPNPEPISFSTSKNVINRQCSECEKEEELQRKESNSEIASVAPPIVQDVLNCSGKSLDTDARSFMEPRFNYDFGNVKIHDNDIAAKSASSINALAYTSGNNVVFNSGQYNTNSDPGKRLLAHELTHVVQQNGSGIQRQEDITPVAPGNQAAKFIVADNMTPAAGQMRKSDFLERLNVEVCATVDETMQGTPFSSDNCPYVRAAFARHQNSSPIELEQVLERYEPSTRTAQSADDLIQRVKIRVASAASRWLQTGDLSDLPEEFRSQIPDGLGVVAGLFSSISSGIGSVVSGIGSVISGIGSLFFKANPGGAQPTQSPESVMQSLGKGNSMDGSTRVKMESAFGTSFSNVEVHTDNNAANLSSNMNARAFTVGNHIAFASQEHKPGTIEGDALLAHELAHVRQQSDGKTNDLQQKSETENEAFEHEADESAINTVTGIHQGKSDLGKVVKRFGRRLKTGLSIQRCPAHTKNKNLGPTTGGAIDPKIMSRDAISNWKTGDPNAILTYSMKMSLIRDLLTGTVSVADQSLILDLIEKSEVVYVKQFIKEPAIDSAAQKFDPANKQRYEAIKKGRALEKVTSGESFQEANIREMVASAIANAPKTKAQGHKSCITTVRQIVISTLYQHLEPRELARLEKEIGNQCDPKGRNNSMEEAMTGVTKAGYAKRLPPIEFKRNPKEIDLTIERGGKTVKFTPHLYPGKLKNSVWGAIEPRIAGKEGWHAFGLAIMDSYHSVTLLVNVRPGGPFLYFVDQVDRTGDPSAHTAKVAPGIQQFLGGKLDDYLEYYAEQNYRRYMQGIIDRREKNDPGLSIKENQLSKMQPSTHIDLWHLSTTKI